MSVIGQSRLILLLNLLTEQGKPRRKLRKVKFYIPEDDYMWLEQAAIRLHKEEAI